MYGLHIPWLRDYLYCMLKLAEPLILQAPHTLDNAPQVMGAKDIMTMEKFCEEGFLAGANAGKAGDRVLWARDMTWQKAGLLG